LLTLNIRFPVREPQRYPGAACPLSFLELAQSFGTHDYRLGPAIAKSETLYPDPGCPQAAATLKTGGSAQEGEGRTLSGSAEELLHFQFLTISRMTGPAPTI
jgi:hypothetical protein